MIKKEIFSLFSYKNKKKTEESERRSSNKFICTNTKHRGWRWQKREILYVTFVTFKTPKMMTSNIVYICSYYVVYFMFIRWGIYTRDDCGRTVGGINIQSVRSVPRNEIQKGWEKGADGFFITIFFSFRFDGVKSTFQRDIKIHGERQ